jgi:hypothetical protein
MRLTSISRSLLDAAASVLLLLTFLPFAVDFERPGEMTEASWYSCVWVWMGSGLELSGVVDGCCI